MEPYLLSAGVLLGAAFTQGLSGFGSVLRALPLLSLFLDIKTVIPFMGYRALGAVRLQRAGPLS